MRLPNPCRAVFAAGIALSCLLAGAAHAEVLTFTNYTSENGLGDSFVRGVYATGGKIYAATNGGLSISANGGANWTNYNSENGLGSDLVMSVYVSGSTIYAGTFFGGLSVSTDDGATWTTYTGVGDDRVLSVYANGSTIYAATTYGLSISTNGGANWTNYTTDNGLASNYVEGVSVVGSTIYAATDSGMSISNNGGANWTNYTTADGLASDYVWDVYATGSNVYAGTMAGLSISTNGGADWTTATGLHFDEVRGVYASGATIYAGIDLNPGGLSISTDAGATWTNYGTANGLGSEQVLGVYAAGGTVYAATRNGLSIGIAAVPEPATWCLALAGLACGGFSMWRRNRRPHGRSLAIAASLACVGAVLAGHPAPAAPITLDMVTVGDPGNASDPATGHGTVDYHYRIGRHMVTIDQYAAFLNAVDPDGVNTYGLFNGSMQSNLNVAGISFDSERAAGFKYEVMTNDGYSGSRPITCVSWFDAARFANWMQNGQGSGDTETGAYTLDGATSGLAPGRNPGAQFYIPTQNEWYKAAYYSPVKEGAGSPGYYYYPTQSDSEPGNTIGDGSNQANSYFNDLYTVTQSADYDFAQNYLTDVGAFTNSASYYGTFDQGGVAYEWNDLDGTASLDRQIRGGSWANYTFYMASDHRVFYSVSAENDLVGFRLASPVAVPEPTTWCLALAGLACGGFSMWRRRKLA